MKKIKRVQRKEILRFNPIVTFDIISILCFAVCVYLFPSTTITGIIIGFTLAFTLYLRFKDYPFYLEECIKTKKFVKRIEEDAIIFESEITKENKSGPAITILAGIACLFGVLTVGTQQNRFYSEIFAFGAGFFCGFAFSLGFWECKKISRLRKQYNRKFCTEREYTDYVLFGKVNEK